MFKKLFARSGNDASAPRQDHHTTRLDRMKAAYEEWRISQDIGAVMAALGRLSDKRLAMIGLHRDTLYDDVTEMMDHVQQQNRIGDEVLAILDNEPKTGVQPRSSEPQAGPTQSPTENGERAAA